MPKHPRPSASEVLRHNLLILVGLPSLILLPAGTSIVLPVGYMNQPTGLLHIYLYRRLYGRQRRRFIQITSSGGYLNKPPREVMCL